MDEKTGLAIIALLGIGYIGGAITQHSINSNKNHKEIMAKLNSQDSTIKEMQKNPIFPKQDIGLTGAHNFEGLIGDKMVSLYTSTAFGTKFFTINGSTEGYVHTYYPDENKDMRESIYVATPTDTLALILSEEKGLIYESNLKQVPKSDKKTLSAYNRLLSAEKFYMNYIKNMRE